MKKYIFRFIPKYAIIPLITALIYNTAGYCGTKFIAEDSVHYYMGFGFEERIPFIPLTVVIYIGCYFFWAANFCLSIRYSKKDAYRFLLSMMTAETVCFLFYIFLPTTIARPDITGGSPAEIMLNAVYKADSPVNLFPSIHCLLSWLCLIGVRKNPLISFWYKVFSCVMAIMICVSTLTVKQHVIIDAFAGIFLAEVCYCLSGKIIDFILQRQTITLQFNDASK